MNKKLLFATMSLAALTACTSDDFESQKVAEEVSPVQFEVINNEAATRASMTGNQDGTVIKWSAADGDLFTLYHGAAAVGDVTGYQNATYKATASVGAAATLTTPSMILKGGAIMVWPVDTTFRIKSGDNLTLTIPAVQENIEDNIPYVSDQIEILAHGDYNGTHPKGTGTESNSLNTAGKDRKYPVFMRPMASQLTVKADYAGTDSPLAELYAIADPIDPISVNSIVLYTAASDKFTTEIPVTFANPSAAQQTKWDTDVPTNNWKKVTGLNRAAAVNTSATLTAKGDCLDGIDGCKVLVLPQPDIDANDLDNDAAVVVNTRYGKVVVAPNGIQGSQYAAAPVDEADDAWGRYIPDDQATIYEAKTTTKNAAGLYKHTSTIADGMMQTINTFSNAIYTSGTATGEQVGVAATRYVKVLLTHLDMDGLHVNEDKWLRDAARVWKKYGLQSATIYLDGTAGEFEISQNTIDVINEVNATATGGKFFHVTPCNVVGEACNTIVITGGGAIKDLRFIDYNDLDGDGNSTAADKLADVALNAGETWSWTVDAAGNYIVIADDADIKSIINRGTMTFAANATLQISDNGITPANFVAGGPANKQNSILFENRGTLNVNSGVLYVQTNVKNYGTVNIVKGAQYRQDGRPFNTSFTNDADTKPARFLAVPANEVVGKVINKGVFATVNAAGNASIGTINNYGLIEHKDVDAKTYITTNQTGGDFGTAFGAANKMGRINLPWSNKEEDNISVSAAANTGFISVTIDDDATLTSTNLNATAVGALVNYVIINSQIEAITYLPATIKFVEVAMTDKTKEIAWNLSYKDANGVIQVGTATYDGLIVLSPVNIKLNTEIKVAKATYLGADMYVGGKLFWYDTTIPGYVNNAITPAPNAFWNGYYGNTQGNYTTKYITY